MNVFPDENNLLRVLACIKTPSGQLPITLNDVELEGLKISEPHCMPFCAESEMLTLKKSIKRKS